MKYKKPTVDELILMSKKTNVVLYERSDVVILVKEIKRCRGIIKDYEN